MLNLKRKESLPDALAHAAETGNVEWLKSTLASGVDVDATNSFGTTALMKASAHGHIQLVRELLSYGADPNRLRNDKFTALALAAFFGHNEVVKCLVEHGADKNASTRFRTSPEMWAAARTFHSVAKYLGDKTCEPPRTTRIEKAKRISVADPPSKPRVEEAGILVADLPSKPRENFKPAGSLSSARLGLRLALSGLVLLFMVGVGEVILEHRQAAPSTISEPPHLTAESTPTQTIVEKTVVESPAPPVNASTNLNHSEDLGRRSTSAVKAHNPVVQSRGQDKDVEETAITVVEESKVKPQVAPQKATPPPVKVTVSRPTSAASRPASSTPQLISSPNSTTKSKVIQWP